MASWSRALEVGVAGLDEHHRALLALHAEVERACERGHAARAAAALERLLAETRDHFEEEQGQLAELDDPGAAAHRDDHDRFLEDLARLRWELAHRGASPLARLLIGSRLLGWFRLHVRTFDAELVRALRARPPAPPG